MAAKDNNSFEIAINGQSVPRMQQVSTESGGTRGASIPPLQQVGQSTGNTGSSGNSGGSQSGKK